MHLATYSKHPAIIVKSNQGLIFFQSPGLGSSMMSMPRSLLPSCSSLIITFILTVTTKCMTGAQSWLSSYTAGKKMKTEVMSGGCYLRIPKSPSHFQCLHYISLTIIVFILMVFSISSFLWGKCIYIYVFALCPWFLAQSSQNLRSFLSD